jgi:hypothetical protein
MSEDLTQFNTRIPKSLYKRFREKVEAEEKTISKVMERLIESYVDGNDSNKLADDINWEKLDERIAIALEGVSCQLPEASENQPVSGGGGELGINQLADFYGCSTDTLNKLIRKETGGKKGDQFSYKDVAWEIIALNPRKFRQLSTNQ